MPKRLTLPLASKLGKREIYDRQELAEIDSGFIYNAHEARIHKPHCETIAWMGSNPTYRKIHLAGSDKLIVEWLDRHYGKGGWQGCWRCRCTESGLRFRAARQNS